MACQPTLKTKRLILRPFALADAPEVQRLSGAPEISATMLHIPYPYPDGMAELWIKRHPEMFETGEGAVFAVERRSDARLVGCVGLGCDLENQNAELGYWIGVPYWNRGYATEAARMAVAFGFAYFGLHRIKSSCFGSNPASGRVLEKIGMRYEGRRREQLFKEGRGFEDIIEYGILCADFTKAAENSRVSSKGALDIPTEYLNIPKKRTRRFNSSYGVELKQPEGLKEISRRLSAAIPPDRRKSA